MTYLVIHQFHSIDKVLKRGQIVDESQLRSPRLRVSEGKVVPVEEVVTVEEDELKEIAVSSIQEPEGTSIDMVEALPELDKNIIDKPLFKFTI